MSLIKKLIAVQQALKAPKDIYNKFGEFKYRSAEDILERAKPLLADQGLLMTISDETIVRGAKETIENDPKTGNVVKRSGDRLFIQATVEITDGEQTHKVTGLAEISDPKKKLDNSQLTGCASSYARKYALCGLFLIDDAKNDPDSMREDGSAANNQPRYQQPQPQPQQPQYQQSRYQQPQQRPQYHAPQPDITPDPMPTPPKSNNDDPEYLAALIIATILKCTTVQEIVTVWRRAEASGHIRKLSKAHADKIISACKGQKEKIKKIEAKKEAMQKQKEAMQLVPQP